MTLQVYLFEDAELKTIFNMAELITELEPEPVIENQDPNAGEEKRKTIISQNGHFCPFHISLLS